jgi:hypothetical protein
MSAISRLKPRPLSRYAAPVLGLVVAGCNPMPGAEPAAPFIHAAETTAGGSPTPDSVTVPVTLDNNRIFAELSFRRPDGSMRKALAWVNMGMSGIFLGPALRDELGSDSTVSFEIGGMPVTVEPKAVIPFSNDDLAQAFGPKPVEAMLSAGVLKQFRVTLDYQAPSLTLAKPSVVPAPGIPVSIKVNDATGLISVDAKVDGKSYPIVIDSGGGYSWWRGSVVRGWLDAHPGWYRAEGAEGQSNQAMVGFDFEQQATVVRVPHLSLGNVDIRSVGILGAGPAQGGVFSPLLARLFWHLWGEGAPEPVDGWIGGNVLRDYRLTIDYAHHVSYWQRTADEMLDDLNSVGISLIHGTRNYFVGEIVQNGCDALIAGVEIGDKLLAVDGLDISSASRGEVIAALHGQAGEHRLLTLDRDGRKLTVDAAVTECER